jgi:hypothetical protein
MTYSNICGGCRQRIVAKTMFRCGLKMVWHDFIKHKMIFTDALNPVKIYTRWKNTINKREEIKK